MEPRPARLHDGASRFGSDADGWIVLADAPGMGYALDEESLAQTRIG